MNAVRPQRRVGVAVIVVLFFAAVGIVGILVGAFGSDAAQSEFTSDDSVVYSDDQTYSGATLQGFTPTEAEQLAKGLAEAEALHGICFGWKLVDGTSGEAGRGSSRGANIPADTCPRWAEVEVIVAAGSTDDDLDAADVRTAGSSDVSPLPLRSEFVKLGVTADSLAAEPVSVTGQAALGLPLLLVESGALAPPQVPDKEPGGATPPPLPPSDGSGSSWVAWAWLGGLGVVAVVALILGFAARGKQKSTSDGGPPPGPPRGGPPPPPPPSPGPPPPPGPAPFPAPQHGPRQPGPPQAPPPPGQGWFQPPGPPQQPRR